MTSKGLCALCAQESGARFARTQCLRVAAGVLRDHLPATVAEQLAQARAVLPNVDTMVKMREELRQLWLNTNHNRAQLALDLQAWCKRAEASGIAALQEFSMQMRAARV